MKRVGAERRDDRDIGGVASAGNQNASDPGDFVARVERVPLAAEVGFEPRGKVTGWIRWRSADVDRVTRAIVSGYIRRPDKFKAGEDVTYDPPKGGKESMLSYKIQRLMPYENGELKYRIKVPEEDFERMAKESELSSARR